MVREFIQDFQAQKDEIQRLRGKLNSITSGNVILSTSVPDFINIAQPAAGAMLVGDSTPAWVQLTLGVAGSVLWSDGSTEPAWVTDVPIAGYLNLGSSAAPANTSPGDLTMLGRLTQSPAIQAEITAAATAIDATAGSVINLTSDANYSLTATPTIASGEDGQELLVINVGANTITLQDEGTLPGSNLRLTAATIGLAPGDSLLLRMSSAYGFWVETAHANLV